ncbi:hypothetical protein [Mesorhizobium cantuariense]|uniref:Uncharacterized protein n=1 Tax=Mesorhizobium cantuariense TaxID=1300275 RepID=A0ABV7MI00_9HYPH
MAQRFVEEGANVAIVRGHHRLTGSSAIAPST